MNHKPLKSLNLIPGWALRAVGWSFGDFIFGTEADVVSDMTKIRLAGFHEDLDPVDALIGAIERQQAAGVIPRIEQNSQRRCDGKE